jgi:hypothetical protein
MTAEQFETTILSLLRHEPFEPFVVEMRDGRLIEIERPKLAVGGGGAGFLTPQFDLVEFECEDVLEIRKLVRGAS